MRITLQLCTAIFLISIGTTAATRTSRVTGDWGSNSTWVGFTVPAAGDLVIIDVGDNVTASSNRTCAGLTINGTLTINSGITVTVNGAVSGAGTLSTGTTTPRYLTVTGNWSFNGTSTGEDLRVTLSGAGDQALSGKLSTGTSCDLTINKSGGTVALGSALTIAGTFTMTAGTFDPGSYQLTAGTSSFTGGTLTVAQPAWASNYSFTPVPSAGTTIEYANANPTINAGITYQNLVFSGTGTAGASGALIVQGNLNSTGGGTLNFGANNVTISGTTAAHSIAGFTTTGTVSMTKTAGTATLTGNVTMGAFTLNGSGGTLNLGSGLTHTINGTFTSYAGTLNLSSCTLNINGPTAPYGGSANFSTSTIVYGGASQTIIPTSYFNLTLAGSGTKSLTYGMIVNGTLTINSGITLSTGSNAMGLNGSFVNAGTFAAGTSAITIGGTELQNLDGFTTGGLITISKTGGTATFLGNITADSLIISGDGATAALNPGVVMTVARGVSMPRPATTANTLAVGSGTLTCGPITLGGTTAGTNNTVITLSNGTMNVSGDITSAGVASEITCTGTGTLNAGGAFMSGVAGTFNAGAGTVNFTSNSAQAIAPFAYTFNNVVLSGTASVKTLANATINGVLSMEATASAADAPLYGPNAKLRYNTASVCTAGPEWVTPFTATGGIEIANTGAVTLNGAKVLEASVPLTINSGGSLLTADNAVTFGGDFIRNGAFTAGSSAITLAGTAAVQTIGGFTTTGLVSFTKTSGMASFAGNVSGGGLTLSGAGGTLDLGAGMTHTFSGTLTRTNGTLNCGSSTVNLSGTSSGSGGSWIAGTSTVNITGGTGQTIPGVAYHNLTITKSGGIATLAGSATVNGLLTLTNGVLSTTDSYVLTLGASASVNGAGSGTYVNGSVAAPFAAGAGSFTFPVGDASVYAPVTVSFGTVAAGGVLTVKTTQGTHPALSASGINPARGVNRYWTLSNNGIAFDMYSAVFNFAAGDVGGGASTGSFVVRRSDGSWHMCEAGTRSSTSTQATTLSSFGDFAVGNQLIDHYTVAASSPQTAGAAFAVAVAAQDILNQQVTDDNATLVTMTSSGSSQFDSNSDGTFGDNAKTLSSGGFSIQARDNVVQTIAITGTDGGGKTGTQSGIVVNPAAASATQSVVSVLPASITADGTSTSAITVQLIDAFGNNLMSSGGIVALNTSSGTIGSVTDNNNGTYSAVLTAPTTVGSAVITGTINGSALSSSPTVALTPGAASLAQSTLIASPASITANGTSTSTVTVQLKDTYGNNLNASGGTVALISTAGTLGSVVDNGNGSYTAVLTSPTGVGSTTISGTLNGSALSHTASVEFTPGPATVAQSLITASASSITADGTSTSTITVQLKDAFGNNLSSSGGAVVLSTTGGILGAVTDHDNGTYSANLTSPTSVGSATISGTLNGVSLISTSTVSFTVGMPSLAQSTVTVSPATILADGSSTSNVAIQLKDAFGNNLHSSAGTVLLSTTSGTLSGVTDNNNGTYSATLTSSTTVGMATISGTLNGSPLASTANVSFTIGAASLAQSTMTASQTSVTADGASTSTITVQLKDAIGHNLISSGGVVVLNSTAGTLGDVTDHGNGTYTSVLTSSTLVGSAVVSGTLNGNAITSTAGIAFVAGAANLAQSTISASPDAITANGSSTSAITVQLKDAFGNNLTSSAGTIVLASNAGTIGSVIDNNNGTYSATMISSTSAGMATITGMLEGARIADSAQVIFTAGAADLAQSTITVSPSSIVADGVSTSNITVQLKDAFGNNLSSSAGTVALSTTAGTLGSVTDHNNGSYSAILTSSTTVGSATLSGALNGGPITATVNVTFVPGSANLAQSILTVSSASITADGSSTTTITVQLKDAFGNNLSFSGGAVVMSATGGTLGPVTDHNNGSYSAVLISPTGAGVGTVSGTLNGSPFAETVMVNFVPGAASLAQSTIVASPTSIAADGTSTSIITVQLKDANGNNLSSSGGTVALTTTRGTLGVVTDSNNGTYSAVLTSSTTAGSVAISGTLNGSPLTATVNMSFTVGTASLAQSTLTMSSASITADGSSTTTITVQLKDANNNSLTVSGGTVILSSTAGILGSVTDHNNGTYTAVLTSATVVGSTTITGTLNGASFAATVNVSFTVGVASLAQSTMHASPDSITADGSSTSTISVQLKDAFGNNLSSSGGSVILSATGGVLGAMTDHTNGTYSAVLTSPTAPGNATISGTLNGSPFTATAMVNFIPGAASLAQSTLTASPASIIADGTSTTTITVQLKDANNNNLTVSGGIVALGTTAGTLGSVTDHNNGSYSAILTSPTTIGSAAISGTLNGSPLASTVNVSFVPGAANLTQSLITASTASIVADSASTSTIIVQLKDANNNNLSVSAGTVLLTTTSGTLSGVTDNNNGTYSAILISSTTLGSATVSGMLNGSALADTAGVNFTIGAPSIARSMITASADSIPANGINTATITVQLKDASGHDLITSGGFVVITATVGTLSEVIDHNNGTYSVILTSPASAGTAAITGTLNGSAIVSSDTIVFTPTSIMISGNAGRQGVILHWMDETEKTATTDENGNYSFSVPYRWSGTVTPSFTGFTFTPASMAYLDVRADQSGKDFTPDAITYVISGNAGVAGVTLSWTDGTAKSATTDSLGAYSITVAYNWSGSVTPSCGGYLFTPSTLTYANVLEPLPLQNYSAAPFVTVSMKAFLAGPYNTTSGVMTTNLLAQGRIPLTSDSAYAGTTYSYIPQIVAGIPTGVVDWVLVELRTGTPGSTKVAVQAALIKNNGQIVDTNGVSPLLFKNLSSGAYYLVVRHRNHLAIMSAEAVALNASSTLYDFSTAMTQAYGTNPMMTFTNGVFGMWAGDANRNGNVKYAGAQNDRSVLLSTVGLSDLTLPKAGYINADFNLDGSAKYSGSANDNSLILRTIGISDLTKVVTTQVPN